MNRQAMSPAEARAALDSADIARARIAALGVCPPWRHAVFGVIMTMLVIAPSLGFALQIGITTLALCLVAVVVRDDRRRMGMFVNGYRRGATRPVALAIAGVTIVLLMAQIEARDHGLSIATRVGIAALEFVVATAGSVMWQRAFVRELRRRSS